MDLKNTTPIVKNKFALTGSAILLVICMLLFFPFPTKHFSDSSVRVLTFPIENQDGIVYIGMLAVALFIVSIILLVMALQKYRGRIILLVLIGYVLLPNILITAYQNTMAHGILAVSYNGDGNCDFEYRSDAIMHGNCEITLKNHSKEQVSFDLEFMDTSILGDERLASLMNYGGPYKITIAPKETKTIHLEETVNVSSVPRQFDTASVSQIELKLIDGKVERVM